MLAFFATFMNQFLLDLIGLEMVMNSAFLSQVQVTLTLIQSHSSVGNHKLLHQISDNSFN